MPDIDQIKKDNPDLSIEMIKNILKSRAEHARGDVVPYSADAYKAVPNG